MEITFRKLENKDYDFKLLYNWCKKEYIYEWFEQRELSFEEIVSKYQRKLTTNKQDLFIIICDDKEIGFLQIYKFENDIELKAIEDYHNIYEFDIFIGEETCLSKGIGSIIVKQVNDMIYSKYNADAIMLRPFKRNIRAIKCYEKCGYEVIDEYDGLDTLNNPVKITILLNTKKH